MTTVVCSRCGILTTTPHAKATMLLGTDGQLLEGVFETLTRITVPISQIRQGLRQARQRQRRVSVEL